MNKTTVSEKIILMSMFGLIALFLILIGMLVKQYVFNQNIADSVYFNGNIYTIDEQNPKASALAIIGQKLVYVGNDDGVKAFIGKKTKVVDLKGQAVLPGLIEGHMHMSWLGQVNQELDFNLKTKAEILDAIKQEVLKKSPGQWIQGNGWNNVFWGEVEYPTKEELDAVSPNNPVILTRTDLHMIWVNSMALDLAKINKDTEDPDGGEILRNSEGEPTGCLIDNAKDPVYTAIPGMSPLERQEALLAVQEEAFSYGLTSVVDAAMDTITLDYMKALYRSKDLKIRVYAFFTGPSVVSDFSVYNSYFNAINPETGLYNDRLSVSGVKFGADGSLGSSSAALFQDYSDQKGYRGTLKFTDEMLYMAMRIPYNRGYQIATHAIGDKAIDQVIRVYERLMKENPRPDPRFRIEHFQMASAGDFKRIADLKILPAMQPTHALSDKTMALAKVGDGRIQNAYAWRKVIDAGSPIIGGSDAPAERLNPFCGLYEAVTRMDRFGQPKGGWMPEEAMTREEAIKAFTIWAAYGQFEENLKGSLEVGKLADFAVLDRDYFTCPAYEIQDISVLLTVLGGEVVYQPSSEPLDANKH